MTVISLFALAGCGSDKDLPDTCPHPNVITGKIIEIKDNNTILLQITEERGGYKVDDKILISYKRIISIDRNDPDGKQTKITPVLNDEVATHFWPDELKKKDGYDYVEVDCVEKYIY